jgi:hypothetical protein
MGLASREKGKRGERLLVEQLTNMGFANAKRGQQVSGLETADVVLSSVLGGDTGLRFESKHGTSSATVPKVLYTQLSKLMSECAPDELPVLCLHRTEANNGGRSTPWLAVVPLPFFTAIARRWLRSLGYTVLPPSVVAESTRPESHSPSEHG